MGVDRIALCVLVAAFSAGCGADAPEPGCARGSLGCAPCAEGQVVTETGDCEPVGPTTCAEGFALEAGSCEPILPSVSCPLGTMARIGKSACEPVGVRTCHAGFVADGRGGCAPVLPKVACADGELATPGDASCRSLGACGTSSYGDAPIVAGQLFVDGSYAGGSSDGSTARPFTSVQAAVDSATAGATIRIAGGVYGEAVRVTKPLHLVGRCARMVSIVPPSGSALDIAASGPVEISGLSASGPSVGIAATSSVLLDAVHVHDTGDAGISTKGDAKVRLEVRSSIVQRARRFGILVSGASARIERSVVSGVSPDEGGRAGHGIEAEARAALELEGCVVDAATETGVAVWGGTASIVGSVVRGTRARGDGTRGQGIAVFIEPSSKTPGTLRLTDSFLDANRVSAVWLRRSSAIIQRTTIRGTRAEKDGTGGTGIDAFLEDKVSVTPTLVVSDSSIDANVGAAVQLAGYDTTIEGSSLHDSGGGVFAFESDKCPSRPKLGLRTSLLSELRRHGLALASHDAVVEDCTFRDMHGLDKDSGEAILATYGEPKGSSQSSVTTRRTLIERSRHLGIAVMGAKAVLESTVVRETLPRESDGGFGIGLYVATWRPGERADVSIASSLFEKNRGGGIELWGSHLSLHSSTVRGNVAGGVGREGRGVSLAIDAETSDAADASIVDSLIDDNGDVGVAVFGSTLAMERSRVRRTRPGLSGTFGDGVAAAYFGDRAASVSLRTTLVDGNARAGVSSFGSAMSFERSHLSCNAIDIDAETVFLGTNPVAPVFSEGAAMTCGCAAVESCHAVTQGIVPLDTPAARP